MFHHQLWYWRWSWGCLWLVVWVPCRHKLEGSSGRCLADLAQISQKCVSYSNCLICLINSTFSMFLCLSTRLASMIKHASCLHFQGRWQETVKSSTFLSGTSFFFKFLKHLVTSRVLGYWWNLCHWGNFAWIFSDYEVSQNTL